VSTIDIPQVSFTRGEVSPIAAARTDAAFYSSAVQSALNFFVRAEGGASNRPGLQYIATCASATPNGSYLLPFVYNNQQSYLTEFAAGTVAVYANGALVQAGIVNPYAYADLPNLRYAQSADVMNVVVSTTPPYQLKRTTATSFTFNATVLLNGPFQDINTDGTTTVYASGTQGVVTITASRALFTPQHVGALFTIQEQFLASINPWESQRVLFQGTNSPIGVYCRSDGKIYKCVQAKAATTATATGTFQPVHTSGTQEDGNGQAIPSFADIVGVSWQFVSSNAGVAQITAYISPTQVTAVVQSDKGVYSNFPPTVVGGPVIAQGPWSFTGSGSNEVFSPLTGATTVDPNQFYVTVGGIFSDPTTYGITGTTLTFNTAPAAGAAVVISQVVGSLNQPQINPSSTYGDFPLTGLCLSTYWAFGSLSQVQGYPATVVYFDDRLVFGGTQMQPQTAFTSIVSNYGDFGVSTPTIDSDGIVFTINARRENPIIDLIPLNDLLIGTASAMWRVTHSASVGAITPSDISLLPQNFYGQQPVASVQTGDTVIYPEWGGRKIRDLAYQFQYDKFVGSELTVYARQMFPFGTSVTRMAYAPEPYGLLFCVRSDGVLCVCAYLPEQQVTAWSRYETQGYFEDVCVLPENGTFAVYVIVRRFINNQTVRYIERFAAREYSTTQDAFFVDAGLTYDGRNTTSTTMQLSGGTTWLANDTGTLNASAAVFSPTDPVNESAVWLNDAEGNRLCRLQIIAYLGATSATVKFLGVVPTAAQRMVTANWTFARTIFSGLTQLINMTVAISADGSSVPSQTVSPGGVVTLPNAQGVVHIGLPYISQLQSLNFNVQGAPTIRNHKKTVSQLAMVVDQSAPFYVGPDFNNLVPIQQRQFELYGQPVNLATGLVHANLPTNSLDDCYVVVQMSDPAPVTVLSWIASVEVGEAN
jgi:hypothetical protein